MPDQVWVLKGLSYMDGTSGSLVSVEVISEEPTERFLVERWSKLNGPGREGVLSVERDDDGGYQVSDGAEWGMVLEACPYPVETMASLREVGR